DLAKQCVDADPSKRPTAEDLFARFYQWYHNDFSDENSEIRKQIEEANEFNEKQPSFIKSINTEVTYITNPQAIYTSRLLNFNNLPEPKNADDEVEYSVSIEPIDFTENSIVPQDSS
ncbi:hypothetical protein C1645_842244, partial [Glomus cerebriforme]